MKFKEKQFEEILDEAIRLQESGKLLPEILALYPEYRSELEPLLSLSREIQKIGKSVTPPVELLQRILANIPEASEAGSSSGSFWVGTASASWAASLRKKVTFRLLAPLVAALVISVFAYSQQKLPVPASVTPVPLAVQEQRGTVAAVSAPLVQPLSSNVGGSTDTLSGPTASDTHDSIVDPVIDELAAFILEDTSYAAEEPQDIEYVESDAGALEVFGQVYYEGDF